MVANVRCRSVRQSTQKLEHNHNSVISKTDKKIVELEKQLSGAIDKLSQATKSNIKAQHRATIKQVLSDHPTQYMRILQRYITGPREAYQVIMLQSVVEEIVKNKKLAPRFETLERIVKRYKQLEISDFERRPFHEIERMRLALFIETNLYKFTRIRKQFFARTDTHLEHAVEYDGTLNAVIIVANDDESHLYSAGTSKTVINAARVDLDDYAKKPQIIARAVLHDSAMEISERRYTMREVEILERYKKCRGIVELKSWKAHQLKGCKDPILTLRFEKYDGDLLDLLIREPDLPLAKKMKIAKDLIFGLSTLHADGVIQGDIKLKNVLYRTLRGNDIEAVHTDFGFAFDTKIGERPPFIIKLGFYGSVFPTSPELLGKKFFLGSYDQMEVWALGCVLYRLYFDEDPPWFDDIYCLYKENATPGRQVSEDEALIGRARAEMVQKIKAIIELPCKILLHSKRKLTPDQNFKLLIYSMLRLSPYDRISIANAKELINKIKL